MRKFLICLVIPLFMCCLGFAKDPEEKTFLILFDKNELKAHKSSQTYIELSLNNIFKTKVFSGNSDAAIVVKVPYEGLDECQLGNLFVRVNANQLMPLQEIALQIIDMDKSKNIYHGLLASYEEKNQKTKKSHKALKATPIP